MDNSLTSNCISRLPFSAKPFSFGFIANRTVPLLSIKTIIRMAIRACRFGGVDGADRLAVFKRVLFRGHFAQMIWIYTTRISAYMIDHMSFSNVPMTIPKSNSMCSPGQLSKIESSVSIFVQRSRPYNASIFGSFRSFIESRLLRLIHVSHMTP